MWIFQTLEKLNSRRPCFFNTWKNNSSQHADHTKRSKGWEIFVHFFQALEPRRITDAKQPADQAAKTAKVTKTNVVIFAGSCVYLP